MKQIKFNFLFKIVSINFFISIIISYLIIYFTPIRYEKNLTFNINTNSIPLRYLKREYNFRFYEDPKSFIKRIDRELRYNSDGNNCTNLGKIKKILPISFSFINENVDVKITSINEKNVDNCSKLIIAKMEQFNNDLKEKFLKELDYALKLKKKSNITLNEQIIQNINEIIKKLEISYSQDKNYNNDILKILTILNLKQSLLKVDNIEPARENFNVIFEDINVVSLKEDKLELAEPPNIYLIFISTFIILIFSYILIFDVINKSTFVKKIKKKLII